MRLTILFLFICLNGFSQSSTVEHSTDLYALQYPTAWELNTTGLMGSDLFVFSPQESVEDQFRENLNIYVTPLSAQEQKLDFDDQVALSLAALESVISDFELLKSERLQNAQNETYQELVFNGSQGIYQLTFIGHLYVKDGEGVTLTFTSEANSFEKYETVARSMLNSFAFKNISTEVVPEIEKVIELGTPASQTTEVKKKGRRNKKKKDKK